MFGISCVPELYNKIIHQVLKDCEGVQSIFDIIVHGKSQEEHDTNLDKLFKKLSEKGLTVNLDKCQFNMPHISFMGHILSKHGICVGDDKAKAVLEERQPSNTAEIRSFLKLVHFSARFILNLATIAEPLRRLTRKGAKFLWEREQDDAFKKLKELMAKACTLAYFDPKATTKVVADASPVGLGAVLIQEQGKDQRVICYASRSLSDVERRYSQTEKEALALVWACERFHMYLFGKEFELLTDHKPLQFIFSPRSKACARFDRCILRLQSYKYKVVYVPGPQNVADCLSRLLRIADNKTSHNKTEQYICLISERIYNCCYYDS
jgi:hypothetical protein